MKPCMKHIAIKYHWLQIFVVNGDIEIKHVDTEEQIVDIFTKPLYSDLFGYLCYKFDSLYINGILLHKGVLY